MNRYIKAKPILFSCVLLVIAFYFIYAATTTDAGADRKSSGGDIAIAGQGPETQPESMKQKPQAFSVTENSSSVTASRGDFLRNTQADPAPEAAKPMKPVEPVVKKTPAPALTPAPTPAPAPAPQKEVIAEVKPEPATAAADHGNGSDLDLLARLITAEAQGEPYQAQVAVGAVVMNRVKSGDWAGTIREVIYQNIGGYYQFTPVVNGWIDKPALPESIEAAKEAMSGADPTNGAQFYYDDKVTNTWILAKPVSVQFGHMIFAY